MSAILPKGLFAAEARNVLRARWLPAYALILGGFTFAACGLGADPEKSILSLQSLVLLIVPMVSILYAAVSWYNAEAFTQLLLTQPVTRSRVFLARWAALSVSLSACYVVGTGTALALEDALTPAAGLLLAIGTLLTAIFTGLGLALAARIDDRMKGIGLALVTWLYCALLHDVLVFSVISALRDYPIEVPGLLMMAANPIDLARVLMLLALDLSAMMGYTGRILQRVLSGPEGTALSATLLAAWLVIPVWCGVAAFRNKDL